MKYRKLILIFFLMITLLGAIFFILTSSLVKNWVALELVKNLEQQIDSEVKFSKLNTNYISWVVINDLKILNDSHDKKPILYVKSLKIRYRLFSLFKKNISLIEAKLNGLNLIIEKNRERKWNLPLLNDSTKIDTHSHANFSFATDKFQIINGNVTFGDNTIPLDISIKNVNLIVNHKTNPDRYIGKINATSAILEKYSKYQRLDNFHGDFQYCNGSLSFKKLKVYIKDYPLVFSGVIKFFDIPEVKANIYGTLNLNKLNKTWFWNLEKNLPLSNAIAHLSGRIFGKINDLHLESDIRIDSTQINQLVLKDIYIKLNYKDHRLTFPKVKVICNDGKVWGKGYLTFNSYKSDHQIDFKVKNLAINPIIKSIYGQESKLKGKLNGSIFFNTTNFNLATLSGKAKLNILNASYKQKTIGNVSCNISIDSSNFNINYTEGKSFISIDGNLSNQFMVNAGFNMDFISLQPFLTFLNIQEFNGELAAHGIVKGSITQPDIKAFLQLKNAMLYDIKIEKATGSMALKQNEIYFKKVHLFGESDHLSFLSKVTKIPNIQGSISYSGTIDGKLSEPELTANVKWYAGKFSFFEFDSLLIHISKDRNEINIDKAIVYHNSLPIFVKGNVDLEKKYTFDGYVSLKPDDVDSLMVHKQGYVTLKGNVFKNNRLKAQLLGENIDLSFCSNFLFNREILSGSVFFNFEADGSLESPEFNFYCNIANPQKSPLKFDSVEIQADYKDQLIEIKNANVRFGINECHLSGEIPYSLSLKKTTRQIFPKNLALTVWGKNLSLDFLTYFENDYKCEKSDLDIDLNLSGSVTEPKLTGGIKLKFDQIYDRFSKLIVEKGNAELSLKNFLMMPQLKLNWACHGLSGRLFQADDFSGEVEYKDSLILLKRSMISINNKSSQFHGYVPFKISFLPIQFQPIDQPLYIKSNADSLNLAILAQLIPSLKIVTGKLSYDVEITGSIKEPIIKGVAYIDKAQVKIKNISPPVTNITAELDFNEFQTIIKYFSANVGSGKIFVSGEVSYKQPGKISHILIESKLNNTTISYTDLFTAIIDTGYIIIKDQKQQYELGGFVNFYELKYVQDFSPQLLLQFAQRASRPAGEADELMKKLKTNLMFRVDNNFWVYNNIARLKMDANLSLLGTPNQFTLAGKIILIKGYFLYLDRKFHISKGTLNFSDPFKINPTIELQATSYIKSYENINETKYVINLSLSGDLEHPKLSLSSDPPLSQSDIVAVLTVGRTRKELLTNGTGRESFKDVLLERAKSITNRTIANLAEKQVGSLLNLDDIIIEGDLLSVQNVKGPKVTASKKLTKELNLTYSTVVGHANDQLIKLGYKLSDKISIEGETDQQGRSGIDLKFKYKFK